MASRAFPKLSVAAFNPLSLTGELRLFEVCTILKNVANVVGFAGSRRSISTHSDQLYSYFQSDSYHHFDFGHISKRQKHSGVMVSISDKVFRFVKIKQVIVSHENKHLI